MKISLLIITVFSCHYAFAQHHAVADSLKYYNKTGQYAKGLPFAIEQYQSARILPEQDTTRIATVYDLGFSYYQLGKYDSAAVYFERSGEAYKQLYGETSTKYTGCLNDLASAYKNSGKSDLAETLYLKTLALKKAEGGEDNGYAITLNQLGLLYFSMGRYNEAEDCFLKECIIFRKSGERTAGFAMAAGNLALIYSRVGNYRRAESLQLQVLEIRKEVLGDKHPMYALALSNLGTLYASMENYVKADSFQTIALVKTGLALKETHPQYLRGLHNLGVNCMNLKQFTRADSLLKEALEGWKKQYGEDDIDYLFMFDALSNVYASMGQHQKAESRFRQSLARYEELQLTQHPYRLELLYRIADFYLNTGAPGKAVLYLREAMAAEDLALREKLNFLSETELIFYLQKRSKALYKPYLFLEQESSQEILNAAYNNQLLFKGIAMQNLTNLSMQVTLSTDSALTKRWKSYQDNRNVLNKLLSMPLNWRTANTDSLAELINQQEKELLRISAEFRNLKEELSITSTDVSMNLKADEAAVEFVRYEYVNAAGKGFIRYAAMIVRPGYTKPGFVKLFDERELVAALKTFAYKSAVRGVNPPGVRGNPGSTTKVYNLLWAPLEPYLSKSKSIFFSPDGLLHQLAFAAIPAGNDKLLSDKYRLIQVTSTREVALGNKHGPINSSVALFGGINYNQQWVDSNSAADPGLYAYAYQEDRGINIDSFSFLPNTLKEVTAIKKELGSRGQHAALFTGTKATEQSFIRLGGSQSPGIIHFATHGFTLPYPGRDIETRSPFMLSTNPLLRCGLVMAGGNKGWKGLAGAGEDDGILTGLEISAVPLQNTWLVVLSACETGLGQVMGSEGVFGLQRAFKLAGARYVMASLWRVPDRETAEFMEHFYKAWQEGKTVRDAFLNTQRVFRHKYPPYYWAGFTLVQ